MLIGSGGAETLGAMTGGNGSAGGRMGLVFLATTGGAGSSGANANHVETKTATTAPAATATQRWKRAGLAPDMTEV
ncbi:hypothetical protein GCM10023213_10180 [Prosthecobacter algae]|uniref:Uncharacterized protein n=1 Tax=Prosthecobacter algae TaxID=1144682 RepID=A0ABP9P356_9BACT